MASQDRGDIYSRITADIIAAIEAGAGEFRMPWHHDGTSTARPVNVASNKPYRGINTLALWAAATHANHGSGIWGTYQQWNAKGAQVRRGERGTTVVFWKIDAQNNQNGRDEENDQEVGRHRVFARAYTVFNSAQVDGYTSPELPVLADDERVEQADRFCSISGLRSGMAAIVPSTHRPATSCRCPSFKGSRIARRTMPSCCTNAGMRAVPNIASTVISPAASGPSPTLWRNASSSCSAR